MLKWIDVNDMPDDHPLKDGREVLMALDGFSSAEFVVGRFSQDTKQFMAPSLAATRAPGLGRPTVFVGPPTYVAEIVGPNARRAAA